MNEIRITFTKDEELNKMLDIIRANYNIKFISKRYRNFKNKDEVEYRVYIKF